MKKKLFLLIAWISLGLGVLGIPLPLLPTTPFVLLSAYCFANGSERWHAWLLNHGLFGPIINDWQKHRGIKPKVKKQALIFTTISFAISIYVAPIVWVKILLVCMYMVLIFWLAKLKECPQ